MQSLCVTVLAIALVLLCPVGLNATDESADEVAADKCKDLPNCAETDGTCETSDPKPICKCPDGKAYDTGKGCIVAEDKCKDLPNCAETDGTCDTSNPKPICKCPDGKAYDTGKGCIVAEDKCKDLPNCAETDGTCDTSNPKPICKCPELKEYHTVGGCIDLKSICKEKKPQCLKTEGDCHMSNEGDVICNCKDGKEYNETIGCAVNKCKLNCGMETALVTCVGDPFGEKDVSCKCTDEKMNFLQEKKICKHSKALSSGGIAGIIICVIIVFVLGLLYVLHRRKKANDAEYQASFRGETITFESALYNATYDSLESNNPQQ